MVTYSYSVALAAIAGMSQALRLAEMATEKQTTRSTGGSSYCIAPSCTNELYRAKAAGVIIHFHRLPLNRKPALNTWLAVAALKLTNPPIAPVMSISTS